MDTLIVKQLEKPRAFPGASKPLDPIVAEEQASTDQALEGFSESSRSKDRKSGGMWSDSLRTPVAVEKISPSRKSA